ncbi:STAS domain-containing protein [Sporosarcina oncorhynchi]|nr:STAS domain-containing protein [Sporosarcina sp. T2O-4]
MYVAWNMSSRKAFLHILSIKSGDSIVLLTTFLLTIFINLTVAVQVGILLAAISFLRQMSGKLRIVKHSPSEVERHTFGEDLTKFIVEGPLFFGTAKVFEDKMPDLLATNSKLIIIDLEHLSIVDATGEAALSAFLDGASAKEMKVVVKKLPKEKIALFKRNGLYDRIGKENFFL